MALRKINFVEGEIYHVYNRGNFKNVIFHDNEDYERFRKLLYMCNGTKSFHYKDIIKADKNAYEFNRGNELVSILCYVFMPNHFHLLIYIPFSKGPYHGVNKNLDNSLSIFMRRLTAAYSMYYNRKYGKTGTLFEGRFKAEHVGDNDYFKYLFSYIHLNPIKLIQTDWKEVGIRNYSEAKTFLENYKYSSLQEYLNAPVPYGGIINKREFLSRIPLGIDLSKEIFSWLNYRTIV